MKTPLSLTLPATVYRQLMAHLFPGDGDEHGAVLAAGVVETHRGTRLIARDLYVAQDGIDYVPGNRGYRMLTGAFITERIVACRDERLAYLAVHNHGGTDDVAFSSDDLRSHQRGYPALLDIGRGMPVGALVFARNAVAGDIWLSATTRVPLTGARVLGSRWQTLAPSPPYRAEDAILRYQRQSLIFGSVGQGILRRMKVGIIGVGGAGSILVELLARLGVGHLVVVDPDRVEPTNLPRLVGATSWDAMTLLTSTGRPAWVRKIGDRLSTKKVALSARVAKRANPSITLEPIYGDFLRPEVATRLFDCDFLFLAADPMPARLLFNAIVQQYAIPGVQIGAKVRVNEESGAVIDVYTAARPVSPDSGCLSCNGLIPADKLQEQAIQPEERRRQRYVNDTDVDAPSVITLNATAACVAANDFLFTVTGLTLDSASMDYVCFRPRERDIRFDEPRRSAECLDCGFRRARGDLGPRLPMKV